MIGSSDTYDAGDTDVVIEEMTANASRCAAPAAATDDPETSLEPLTGLDDGAVGWRTYDGPRVWGEYAVIPLDETHLLAVGFETDKPEPPIEINELIRLALEGVERVGLDD